MSSGTDRQDAGPLGFAGLGDLLGKGVPTPSTERPGKHEDVFVVQGAEGLSAAAISAGDGIVSRGGPPRIRPQPPSAGSGERAQSLGGNNDEPTGLGWVGAVIILGAILFGVVKCAGDTPSRSSSTRAAETRSSSSAATPNAVRLPSTEPRRPLAGTTGLLEVRPPVGKNEILTAAMLNYCLAERIRIEAGEDAIRPDRDADFDRFNAMVDDYNSRCSEYRYRKVELTAAQEEVEYFRAQLEKEGALSVRGRR